MKQRLFDALGLSTADYCEVRFENSHVLTMKLQGRGSRKTGRENVYGGNVRALYKGCWGFSTFNNLSDLKVSVATACEQAKFAGSGGRGVSKLAGVPVVDVKVVPPYDLDPRSVSLGKKIDLLENYNDLILNYSKDIIASEITYTETTTKLYFANSEGTFLEQEKMDIQSFISPTARRGDVSASATTGRDSSCSFNCMYGAEEDILETCRVATALLDASQVKADVYPVVCDHALSSLFVHEAFGHLSEADGMYKNPAKASTMALGRLVGNQNLTIYDTGEYPNQRGYLQYDDEGVLCRRSYLVQEGVLVGRLHSRETAGVMGEEPTGNARAISYRFPPIVRMRNTCITPGKYGFEDLISDIKLGVYAVGTGKGGGQTSGEMFSFMASHGYMIRDGKVAELVKDIKLMGNVFTTLKEIDMIGDTPKPREGGGGCGKGSQKPLQTSGLCPHVRIQNVVVGGVK